MSPAFSVIVPTHDRPELLARALRSVLDQACDSWECIVVDDASARMPSVPADGRVRLVSNEGARGPAGARNFGVACASGDALAFLDDDDRYLPRRLDLAAAALERAPVGVSWCLFEDEPLTTRGRVLNGAVHDTILDGATPHPDGTAIRRDAWLPLDESYPASADVLWWLQLAKAHEVATVEEVGALLGRHAGVRSVNPTDERIRQSIRLLEEQAAYFDAHPDAAAYRWRRISALARRTGDRTLARRAAWRALRARPSLATVRSLASALSPTSTPASHRAPQES